MENYSFDKEKASLLAVDERMIAALPYILIVLFRLFNTLRFIIESAEIMEFSLWDILLLYMSTYMTYIDLFIVIIPLVMIIAEKRSKLVVYHSFQYLALNLIVPLVYVLITGLIFLAMSLFSVTVLSAYLYLYFVMMLYGMIMIIVWFLDLLALYNVSKRRSGSIPLVTSICLRLTNKKMTNQRSQ